MKISEVSLNDVKNHIGYTAENQNSNLNNYMAAALAQVKGHTGLSETELDEHEDITIAYLCIVNDLFTNRCATAEKATNENPTVKTILGMYSKNYL